MNKCIKLRLLSLFTLNKNVSSIARQQLTELKNRGQLLILCNIFSAITLFLRRLMEVALYLEIQDVKTLLEHRCRMSDASLLPLFHEKLKM